MQRPQYHGHDEAAESGVRLLFEKFDTDADGLLSKEQFLDDYITHEQNETCFVAVFGFVVLLFFR